MIRGSIRQGQKQNTVAGPFPASNAGINAVDSLAEMQPNECVYTYNLIAQDYGMEVRPGYAEWANGWTGTAKTVVTFEGATTAQDKLWVADENGLWDCTAADTTTPTQVVTFGSTSGDAGICSYITYSTDGSAQFVLLCDGENGYYVWTQSTNTWAKVAAGGGGTQISGVDPADFVFVMAWKERVWFIEKDTSKAWYLAANAIYGTATGFIFGGQFIQGGDLRAMYNWTLDGGVGIDDYLVAVSGAGDVSIYQGTDPASYATISMVGTWNIGKVPAGNRIGRNFGGELYLLSSYGLLPASALLKGASTRELEVYASRNITPYLRATFDAVIDDFGWHIPVHPKKSLLYINAPKPLAADQISYCMYFGNTAWSMVRGLAKNHTAEWQGGAYWCDDDKLYQETGNVDKVYINTGADGDAEAIEWDCLTAFQALGQPSTFKRVQYIRPNFVAEASPSYDAFARYDYNISEATSAPISTSGAVGIFGTGLWGTALWAGGLSSSSNVRGATGVGRMVAVVLRGASSSPTSLVSYDVYADLGGLM